MTKKARSIATDEGQQGTSKQAVKTFSKAAQNQPGTAVGRHKKPERKHRHGDVPPNRIDPRTELGPDGVLLWALGPNSRISDEDDPGFPLLTKQHPDMAEWAAWGHRYCSVVYQKALNDAHGRKLRTPQQAAALSTIGVVQSLKVFFFEYLGQRKDESGENAAWAHPLWRASPVAMLTPLEDQDAEIDLRDDFWRVCCERTVSPYVDRDKKFVSNRYFKGATYIKHVAGFLDFVAERLSVGSARPSGKALRNPFWTRNVYGTYMQGGARNPSRQSDKKLNWIDRDCPRLSAWKPLAQEYVGSVTINVPSALNSLSIFIGTYLAQAGQPNTPSEGLRSEVARDPTQYLMRANRAPDTLKQCTKTTATINGAVDFLDWLLLHKYSEPDDHGGPPIRSPDFCNPLTRADGSGSSDSRESSRMAMPYAWIDELRRILCEGETFRDWIWAQQAHQHANGHSADWFEVDETLLDKGDPDCVWRERSTGVGTWAERTFVELWSPVRWVALLIKLNTALRTMQVRMLDSGESDEWRFDIRRWATHGAPWVINEHMNQHLARSVMLEGQRAGRRSRTNLSGAGWANGVLRRVRDVDDEQGFSPVTTLYANTNKTADNKKEGAAKGFEFPLPMEPCPIVVGPEGALIRAPFADQKAKFHWLESLSRNVHYWLAKLRDWQAKYNPIDARTHWSELAGSGLMKEKSEEQLGMYQAACFLFREPCMNSGRSSVPHLPIRDHIVGSAWWALLKELQHRFAARAKTNLDGSPIRLVKGDTHRASRVCEFDLHSLRVSLITALIVEGKVDMALVQKIVGHSRILMTAYYTKFNAAQTQEELRRGVERMDREKYESEARFLASASSEQIRKRMALNDEESVFQALGINADTVPGAMRSASGWLEMLYGICPVGGNTQPNPEARSVPGCFNGGPSLDGTGSKNQHRYAPVEGGARSCPNCRWFITGPSYLFGLVAKFNNTAYHLDEAKKVAQRDAGLASELNADVYDAEKNDVAPAVLARLRQQLDEAERRADASTSRLKDLVTVLANTDRLINRCLAILRRAGEERAPTALVLAGGSEEWKVIVSETDSELLQVSIVADDAEVYPDLDPGKAIVRRSQIIDGKLMREGLPPAFMYLAEEDQHRVGNALMRRMAAVLSPERPAAGIHAAVRVIESSAPLSNYGLNRAAMEQLLQACKSEDRREVISLLPRASRFDSPVLTSETA